MPPNPLAKLITPSDMYIYKSKIKFSPPPVKSWLRPCVGCIAWYVKLKQYIIPNIHANKTTFFIHFIFFMPTFDQSLFIFPVLWKHSKNVLEFYRLGDHLVGLVV